jgi:predicted double-glycine peptidase
VAARILLVVAAIALAACETPPPAPPGQLFWLGSVGMRVNKPVTSLRAQRFENIVPQKLDFSCGAASLGTLLRYFYDDPVEEDAIILSMLENGDRDRIRREGFSLADMKGYAESKGYETRGYRVKPEILERLAIPAITLVKTRGYGHFVVIKGSQAGIVYLADPAMGHRAMRRDDFMKEWSGVVFFVAAERDPDAWAPLERLDVGANAPVQLVHNLERLGRLNLTFNPLEF